MLYRLPPCRDCGPREAGTGQPVGGIIQINQMSLSWANPYQLTWPMCSSELSLLVHICANKCYLAGGASHRHPHLHVLLHRRLLWLRHLPHLPITSLVGGVIHHPPTTRLSQPFAQYPPYPPFEPFLPPTYLLPPRNMYLFQCDKHVLTWFNQSDMVLLINVSTHLPMNSFLPGPGPGEISLKQRIVLYHSIQCIAMVGYHWKAINNNGLNVKRLQWLIVKNHQPFHCAKQARKAMVAMVYCQPFHLEYTRYI